MSMKRTFESNLKKLLKFSIGLTTICCFIVVVGGMAIRLPMIPPPQRSFGLIDAIAFQVHRLLLMSTNWHQWRVAIARRRPQNARISDATRFIREICFNLFECVTLGVGKYDKLNDKSARPNTVELNITAICLL